MPDPFGFVQNQRRGDATYFDGTQWQRTNRGVVIDGSTGTIIYSEGSSGAPIGRQGYSLLVSRDMAVSTAGDSNAAIFGQARNNGSTQPVAVRGDATQNGSGDVCGGYFQGNQSGSGSAFGVFSLALWGASAKANYGAFGVNPVMVNNSNLNWGYDGSTTVGPSGVLIQCLPGAATSGAKTSGTGITITTVGGDAAKALFDVGIGFWTGSIKTADMRTDTSAVTVLDARGSHTDGVDFTNGTFSGSMVKFPACATYTPTITSQTGALTTAAGSGRYLHLGKMLWVSVDLGITNNGTGGGAIFFTLPLSLKAVAPQPLVGRANAVSGKELVAMGQTGSSSVFVLNYDATYPASSGEVLEVSGWLEVQ